MCPYPVVAYSMQKPHHFDVAPAHAPGQINVSAPAPAPTSVLCLSYKVKNSFVVQLLHNIAFDTITHNATRYTCVD
jgi:hypothetical protein